MRKTLRSNAFMSFTLILLSVMVMTGLSGCSEPKSKDNDIVSFKIDDAFSYIEKDSVTVIVPVGRDLTAIAPVIQVSEYAKVSPESGVAQNFTYPVRYTVKAENGDTKTYEVVVNSDLQGISIGTLPTKTTYIKGEALNTAGIIVIGQYSANSNPQTREIPAGAITYKGFDPNEVGFQTITLFVEGMKQTFTVEVLESDAAPLSIAITRAPYKTTYLKGDALDLEGMIITGTYDVNGSVQKVIANSAVAVNGYTATTVGTQRLTVTYAGKTASGLITVEVVQADELTLTIGTVPGGNGNLTVYGLPASGNIALSTGNNGAPRAVRISVGASAEYDYYGVATVYSNIQWYVDNATAGTGNFITLNAANYTLMTHTVTIVAKKDGVEHSTTFTFTVGR